MELNITPLVTLLVKQVAPFIIEKIKNKISPDELQRAILAGIKAAETEEENFPKEQHLFFNSKPDSLIDGVPGFFRKFFQVAGVQGELAKPFNDQGLLNVDYLAENFNKVAADFKEVNPVENRVKPWLNTFAQIYFQETNYLRFKVAKQDYFKQLNQRYDDIKFAGIAVSGQEEDRKTLQQIFVMPDVVERETNKQLFPDEFIDEQLTPQQRLILEQKQLAKLSKTSNNPFLANKLLTKTQSKKAVILGAPGSGKSTLVSYFAVMLSQGKAQDLGLDKDTDWLPIVVEIRDLERNLHLNFLEYLHQFAEINLTTNKLPEEFFKHWLTHGKALILLDGIDEVAETSKRYQVVERIASFLHQYDKNIAIITSRPSGYKRDFFSTTEFPHYQLQPFDDDKIEEFIKHWYDSRYDDPQEANRDKENLNKALQKKDRIKLLAENPLLLTIIALIHRNQANLPNQRYELYDCAVKTLLTSWDENKWDRDQKLNIKSNFEFINPRDFRQLMRSLAYWIHTQGNPEDSRGGTLISKKKLIEELARDIAKKRGIEFDEAEIEAENFVDFIRTRTGLLNEQVINRYAFVHKTFQEYLCSQEIYYQARSTFDFKPIEDVIKQHLHDSHWREVLLLLVSQLEGTIAVKAIRTILENHSDYEQWLHRDLFFAASCLAENPQEVEVADDGLADEILKALINLEIGDENKIASEVRKQVFSVITSFAETDWEAKALDLLKEQRDKIEQFRFIKYQAALGEIESAIEALLTLLKDNNSSVRRNAASVLGNLGKGKLKVIEALITLLRDDDVWVRASAAIALENIGKDESQVIEALLPLLQDNDSEVRRRTAIALENIGKDEPQVIEALLPLLQDNDSEVRRGTASALGNIGKDEPQVIEALLPLLQDNDSEVRFTALQILRKIGKNESQVVQSLIALLQDNDFRIRYSAVSALGKIGKDESQVIEALLTLLQDNDSEVRRGTASALGNIGKDKPQVIKALLPLLQDNDSEVRFTALQILRKIGKNESQVVQSLIALLQDNDFRIRYSAASALGNIGKDKSQVIEALLTLLQDNDFKVRRRAALSLGNIGKNEPKIVALIENWSKQHQNTNYVGNGIDVLWNLVADES